MMTLYSNQASFCARTNGSVLREPWCATVSHTVLTGLMRNSAPPVLCFVTRRGCAWLASSSVMENQTVETVQMRKTAVSLCACINIYFFISLLYFSEWRVKWVESCMILISGEQFIFILNFPINFFIFFSPTSDTGRAGAGASLPLKCPLGSKPCRDGKECVLYSHVCDGEKDLQRWVWWEELWT